MGFKRKIDFACLLWVVLSKNTRVNTGAWTIFELRRREKGERGGGRRLYYGLT